jgi:adenylate kinase
VSAPEIVNRLTGRRSCPSCRAVYHLTTRPPRTDGICDHCRTPLVQREKDRLQVIRARLAAYNANAIPLIGYYRARGVLLPITAVGSPQEIFADTLAAFKHATSSRPPISAHPFSAYAR